MVQTWALIKRASSLGVSPKKRHVILPHNRDVNIFLDIILGWLPLGASVNFFPLINNCVISYFRDKKSPFVLCLCVFSTKGIISSVCVFFTLYVFFYCFLFSFHMFPLLAFISFESISSLIWRFWSPCWTKILNMPIDNVKLGFMTWIRFTSGTWFINPCARSLTSPNEAHNFNILNSKRPINCVQIKLE
jgi:hypothetical protein